MKAAGIARALVLTTALTVIGMLFAGVTGAAPLVRPMNLDADGMAVDGTDIYWSRDHMVGPGSYEEILYRGSFLDKSKVELARFGRKSWETVEGISAGGGYVAVSLNNEFFGSGSKTSAPTTRVIRFSRDGSRRDVIATGRIDTAGQSAHIVKRGVAYLNDCGTRVSALSTSATGSVVIGQVTGERNSERCGGKKNVDHWRYYEQRLDGTQREIFAKDRLVKLSYKRLKHGRSWTDTSGSEALVSAELIGDRALIRSATSIQYFVRDLNTGTLSTSFDFPAKPGSILTTASMALNGSVALNGFFADKKSGVILRAGVFPTAAPSNFKEAARDTELNFCGSHLISTPFDTRKIFELDPVTLAPVRTVGMRPTELSLIFGIELGCDDDYLYGVDVKERPDGEDLSVSLLAYPLK
ncbi:MAG: hypothetical protein ACRDKE_08500 [Solirubrobacterales bacterium]